MKYLAIVLLLMSFAGIGVFGFALIDHNMQSPNNDCVTPVMDGVGCPVNIVAMTLHHVSAIHLLTTTMVSPIGSVLLLLASMVLISVSIILSNKKDSLLPKLGFLPQRLRDLTLHSLYSKQKSVSWLSLFELSPSL